MKSGKRSSAPENVKQTESLGRKVDGGQWFTALTRGARELLVIVVGVLIALAGNAWWEGRAEREREQAYIQQLTVDTEANIRSLEGALEHEEQSRIAANRILAELRSGRRFGRDSLTAWTRSNPTFATDPRVLLGTFRTIAEGPDMNVLRDEDLRFAVIKYLAIVQADIEEFNRYVWHDVQVRALARGENGGSNIESAMELPAYREATIDLLLAGQGNPQLRHDFIGILSANIVRQYYLRRMVTQSKDMMTALDAARR